MDLGAKVKVAMDTSAVRRGIGRIRGMFRSLHGVLRGIGSAMRKSMVPVIGLLAGFGFAARRVANLGSELSDMSVQTGVSVGKLVEMQEALRLAGVPMRDTSRMLSLLASNLQEARDRTGEVRDGFHELGFRMGDFEGMNIAEVFDKIIERIGHSGDEIKNLEFAMEKIFGARIGFGILRLAKDFADNMGRAERTSSSFAKFMEENANELDRTADALGRIQMLFDEIIGRVMMRLPLDEFAKSLENFDLDVAGQKLRNTFIWLREEVAGIAKSIGTSVAEGFNAVMDLNIGRLGELFAKGIKSELLGSLGSGGGKSMLKGLPRIMEEAGRVLSLPFPGQKPIEIKSTSIETRLNGIQRGIDRLDQGGVSPAFG